MGMVDSPNGKHQAKKGRRQLKRLGFHLDMTPMVDVAFLLLTFFMLTTTFSKSNTMEINMPPETGEVRIAEQNVMTVRIAGDGMAYCSLGEEIPRRIALYGSSDSRKLSLSGELRSLLRKQTSVNKKMVIVVKISEKAKYKNLVDLIDELNLMKIDRFSLDDYTDQDEAAIKRAV
ncbi:MAG: biopolymer transporter ExbD [Chlorobium sp.]|jgi:biopolymer transport protein ExbD|uniref:ExbD/TolR family protein n=1 Tax=Chlorobium sp. TaxID=1095 RepID=UPI0025C272A6|nr:biopolymer transporter ExbD [Chlorobium sp.]MCF8215254.1 biopolymer transporter ExbD [Chlorobium sp.]MCF8270089.1 biopolymer transporter ExbD [Chlorobium sp.]MCF8286460.1 biopolymer transporter ExbD [Chlorobium sp.]MCF8290058.1 biopolymer transporter ExbD [Chlorobium sp.]MCF8384129.1 biopolymer transporter ExbD [Chlorobium sp.]